MKTITLLFLLSVSVMARASGTDVEFSGGWIKQLPPVVPMRAGYIQISNPANTAVSIVDLHSEAFEKVEMHETTMADGMMKMIKLDSIPLAPKSTVELKPGAKHLMLINPVLALRIGDNVSVQVTFSDLTTQVTHFVVKK